MGWGLGGDTAVNKTKFSSQWGRQLRKKINESKSKSDGEKSYEKRRQGRSGSF